MRNQRTKKTIDDQSKHARRRAHERYGIYLTDEDYKKLIERIKRNDCEVLLKESNTRTHFLVDCFIVVYDKARGSIATFLPPEAIHTYLPNPSELVLSE